MSNPQNTDNSYLEALRESDALGDVMEREGISMPSMETMREGIQQIVAGKDGEGKHDISQDGTDDELDDLLEDRTPVLKSSEVFQTPVGGEPSRISIQDEEEKEEDVPDYAESFASQRETSQLREELEQMSMEMKNIKASLSGLLKEREALPGHLTSIREDINHQMTLMLEKLHSAMESDVGSSNVKAAATTLEEVKSRSTERLTAAADYAQDRPRESSPLATHGAELKGKRRFRPVK